MTNRHIPAGTPLEVAEFIATSGAGDQPRAALPEKLADRIKAVGRLAGEAWPAAGQEVASIMADTERALKRAMRRADELEGAWERVEFVPTRGATVEFTGRLLAADEFETKGRDPIRAHMQIWETRAGALVAVDETQRLDGVSTQRLAVLICPPTGDAQEQRFAVMEHFGWSTRARTMARKLGWSLRIEVE